MEKEFLIVNTDLPIQDGDYLKVGKKISSGLN